MKHTSHTTKQNSINIACGEKEKKSKKSFFRSFAITTLSAVIALCAGISLYCAHAILASGITAADSSSAKESVSAVQREPAVPSISVSDSLGEDFTRTLTVSCKNTDGTTEGLLCFVCSKEDTAPDADSEWLDAASGTVALQLGAGSYSVYLANRYGKETVSDTVDIAVDAVTSIKIDNTDPYLNVGM